MKIYLTSSDNVHTLLNQLLTAECGQYKMVKNDFGKPYIEGNPVYFNISHSGNFGCIAISDKVIGVDLEVFRGKIREHIFLSFNENERKEINSESDFLIHFTAREAYVKNRGLSLFALYKRLSFINGEIYIDGQRQPEKITSFKFENFVLSVCGEGQIELCDKKSD